MNNKLFGLLIICASLIFLSCEEKDNYTLPDSLELRFPYDSEILGHNAIGFYWNEIEAVEGLLPIGNVNIQINPIYRLEVWDVQTDSLYYSIDTFAHDLYVWVEYDTEYKWQVTAFLDDNYAISSNVRTFRSGLYSYSGWVTLSTQSEVDEFGVNQYQKIGGNLTIEYDYYSEDKIHDLTPLSSLKAVTGKLLIEGNEQLSSLNGLENIIHVGELDVSYFRFDTFSAFQSLEEVLDDFSIVNCDFKYFNGFNNLKTIGGEFNLYYNNELISIESFNQLNAIDNRFTMKGNANLADIDGFSNLQYIGGDIVIANNFVLNDYCWLQNFLVLNVFESDFDCYGNDLNPTIEEIINMDCDK
jgi:hypothetical protein